MEEIAPGVYVKLDYEGANVGCILTDIGAIVVDTPSSRRMGRIGRPGWPN